MPPSRLGCPLSLKAPNMGNTGLARFTAGANEVFLLSRWGIWERGSAGWKNHRVV